MWRPCRRILCLAVFLSGFVAAPTWASALVEATKSVVAVLPEWPGGYRRQGNALEEPEGSAVAVLPGGYLATNAHVLSRAKRVDVRFSDGRLQAAEIVGRDVRTDIALIKVSTELPVLKVASPPALGERVCAISNQFGLGTSVTCGVVSALNRSNAGFNPVEDFIQTDAAVNPGASGGALVDGEGRLVGLLSAIFTKQSDANIGVNFATSVKLMMRVIEDLRDNGRVRAGRPGWRLTALTPIERRQSTGIRVVWVNTNGAASKAGVQVGDILVRVSARSVYFPSDAVAALYMHRPGDRVLLQMLRDGSPFDVEIFLSE